MKTRIIGKLCSAVLFGFLFCILMQQQFASRRHMTREDFLAKQAARYDKEIKNPTSFTFIFVASFLTTGVLLGAYELVGIGISKVSEKEGE
jgi:hypothetical protein